VIWNPFRRRTPQSTPEAREKLAEAEAALVRAKRAEREAKQQAALMRAHREANGFGEMLLDAYRRHA